MGSGKVFKCTSCGKEFMSMTGIGMGFSNEYQEIVSKIKNGEYGEDFKKLMNSKKGVVVDLERNLYICKKCGNWTENYCFDFYVPKKKEDIEKVSQENFCVMPHELKDGYELILKIEHSCDKCGSDMRKIEPDEECVLKCPDCGKELETSGWIDWD